MIFLIKSCLLLLIVLFHSGLTFSGTEHIYQPSDEVFPNPERGLNGFIQITDPLPPNWYEILRDQGLSLTYASLNLENFRTTAIDTSTLEELLPSHFLAMRSAGVKSIVRINYGAGGDTTLTQMKDHLIQLQPVLEEFKDVIAFFQAGMIGAWGEWHGSTNGLDNAAGYSEVYKLLITFLPACIPIQVRTPYKAQMIELEMAALNIFPLDPLNAFDCSPASRLGHHNDCWLASDSDQGTYAFPSVREYWLERLEEDTRYVPWGGENCTKTNSWCNCSYAPGEAERLHITYLNRDRVTCLNDCLDTFRKNLGYRFQLKSATLPDKLFSGKKFSIELTLQNIGWAPMYNERPVYLRLFLPTSPVTVLAEYPLIADPRFWAPEEGEITIHDTLTAPVGIHAGVSFALWMPDSEPNLHDESKFSVRFANQNVWDDQAGHNLLAESIPLQQLPPNFTGLFRPGTNVFYLDANGSQSITGADTIFGMGAVNDIPLVGDWNCDGVDELGLFRPSNNFFYLDIDGNNSISGSDPVYIMGAPGDMPLVGDWNGDGTDEIGLYRPSAQRFFLDTDGDGRITGIDAKFYMGSSGDMPLVGDWNGDGRDEVGLFRPSTNFFYLDSNGDQAITGADTIAIMGGSGDQPLVGDWNADGADEIGLFRPSNNRFFLDSNRSFSITSSDIIFRMGSAGDRPLIGRWQ